MVELTINFLSIINKNNVTINVNSWIRILIFTKIYNIELSKKIINEHVFRKTKRIQLSGTIKAIQTDLFKSLDMIVRIDMYLDHIRRFFHSSYNEWMKHIFSGAPSYNNRGDMYTEMEQNRVRFSYFSLSDSVSEYDYPHKDFCLFQHFPFSRPIFMRLLYSKNIDFVTVAYRTVSVCEACPCSVACQ